MRISEFIDRHYRHFNAAALKDAADGYIAHLDGGGRMLMALAGAMSTAELGLSLAEMIRQGKVHAISCTGANLEEDVFNLVAHDHYRRIPNWRDLTPEQEKELEHSGLNRVTDTCIPEDKAFRAIEHQILELWQRADKAGQRFFPHEFFYQLLRERMVEKSYQIDPRDSWLMAASEKNLPIFYTVSERRPDMLDSGVQVGKSHRGREKTSQEGTHATQTVAPLAPLGAAFRMAPR